MLEQYRAVAESEEYKASPAYRLQEYLEQNVIYYATFKLGDSTVYVENAGAKTESESVKNDLATIIQELINNGALDLSSFNG